LAFAAPAFIDDVDVHDCCQGVSPLPTVDHDDLQFMAEGPQTFKELADDFALVEGRYYH
jgi:hypothetical protein